MDEIKLRELLDKEYERGAWGSLDRLKQDIIDLANNEAIELNKIHILEEDINKLFETVDCEDMQGHIRKLFRRINEKSRQRPSKSN